MPGLNINTLATTVANQIAAIQTQASSLVSFTTGSILRATTNSNAAIGMWLQGLSLQVMALSRFATSFGSDADTWGLDWGFFRAPATFSTGFITYGRFTSSTNVSTFIPVGALSQTADLTQQVQVIADATNPAYVATPVAGYNMLSGTASITVKAQSINAAYAANIGANLISSIVTSIPNIDFVNNSLQFVGGTDPEQDPTYKARFPAYLISIARGTPAAIQAAIEAMQVGTECRVIENVNPSGQAQLGYLTIIVDDGSGAPSSTFLSNASAIANAYRSGGIQYGVFGPSISTVNVTYTITTADGYLHSDLITVSQNSVFTYIDALLDGAFLPWSQLYQVIYNSSPGITDVSALLVNGATADLIPATFFTVYKAGTVVGT